MACDEPCQFGEDCFDQDACTDDACVDGCCVHRPACQDTFVCYDTKLSKKSPKFIPIPNTHVEDYFEDLFFTVTEARELCNPAGRQGTVPESPTHLNRYQIAAAKNAPRNMAKNVLVETEFGTFPLDLVIGDKLLVPTAKSLTGPPAPLQTVDVDHFKCYDVILHKGTKFPKGLQITLTDQFYTTPRKLDVKAVAHLCPVARKNGEPVLDPCGALVCFDVRPAKGAAKFKAVKNAYTNDQFGALKQDTVDDDEVCVPGTILRGQVLGCLSLDGQ